MGCCEVVRLPIPWLGIDVSFCARRRFGSSGLAPTGDVHNKKASREPTILASSTLAQVPVPCTRLRQKALVLNAHDARLGLKCLEERTLPNASLKKNRNRILNLSLTLTGSGGETYRRPLHKSKFPIRDGENWKGGEAKPQP
jgi:hypothetical protein